VLSVEISDDGRGLSADDLAKAGSFGLRGLRERAETVGGWVDVSAGAERGTSVILSVPLAGAARLAGEDLEDERRAFAPGDQRHNPSAWGDP
jgi:glucose-6-phosphate-specific signal transduction histidine kinase